MVPKVVFITVFHSFISKNLLNSGVLDRLRAAEDYLWVLLVPEAKLKFFQQQYQFGNVRVEVVDSRQLIGRPLAAWFSRLAYLLIDSHYLWYKKVERRQKSRSLLAWPKYWFEVFITKTLAKSNLAGWIFRRAYQKLVCYPYLKDLFIKYQPVALFATDVFDETDVLIMTEARARQIPIVGMVRSWDNCYSKGLLRVVPDWLMVNNKTIKEEAVNLHEVSRDRITVVGLPQFDHFLSEVRMSRDDFFRKIGGDPKKRLIVFSPAGAILSDTDDEIGQIISQALQEGKINLPAQLLIRNHPHHPADLKDCSKTSGVIIENPGRVFGGNLKEVELTEKDSRHLADTLYYADVVVWVATTLGLDALVFDKPQVVVNFDGWQEKQYTDSVRRYHDEDHMKKMLALGGMKIANNPKELIDYLNGYLINPSLDRGGRQQVIEQQLYRLDGHSAKRLVDCLLSLLKKNS